jgi:hypothetical protein
LFGTNAADGKSELIVGMLAIIGNTLTSGVTPSIFRIAFGDVICSGARTNNNIVNSANFYKVSYDNNATGSVEISGFLTNDQTTADVNNEPTPTVTRRINDNSYSGPNFSKYQLNGKNVNSGTTAPTSGTWAVGDVVWNTAPASGLPTFWVCSVAGTPGTWIGIGSYDQNSNVGAGVYIHPNDLGYKAWSIDPRYVSTTGFAPTAGTIYVAKLRTPDAYNSGININHELYVIQAGTGVTALANCFVGLYRADTLAQIAVSTDRSGSWNSVSGKQISLTTTAAKPAGVDLYAAIIVGTQATTNVQFGRVGAVSAVLANGSRLSAGNSLFATADTGASALPATLAALTANSVSLYHGLY